MASAHTSPTTTTTTTTTTIATTTAATAPATLGSTDRRLVASASRLEPTETPLLGDSSSAVLWRPLLAQGTDLVAQLAQLRRSHAEMAVAKQAQLALAWLEDAARETRALLALGQELAVPGSVCRAADLQRLSGHLGALLAAPPSAMPASAPEASLPAQLARGACAALDAALAESVRAGGRGLRSELEAVVETGLLPETMLAAARSAVCPDFSTLLASLEARVGGPEAPRRATLLRLAELAADTDAWRRSTEQALSRPLLASTARALDELVERGNGGLLDTPPTTPDRIASGSAIHAARQAHDLCQAWRRLCSTHLPTALGCPAAETLRSVVGRLCRALGDDAHHYALWADSLAQKEAAVMAVDLARLSLAGRAADADGDRAGGLWAAGGLLRLLGPDTAPGYDGSRPLRVAGRSPPCGLHGEQELLLYRKTLLSMAHRLAGVVGENPSSPGVFGLDEAYAAALAPALDARLQAIYEGEVLDAAEAVLRPPPALGGSRTSVKSAARSLVRVLALGRRSDDDDHSQDSGSDDDHDDHDHEGTDCARPEDPRPAAALAPAPARFTQGQRTEVAAVANTAACMVESRVATPFKGRSPCGWSELASRAARIHVLMALDLQLARVRVNSVAAAQAPEARREGSEALLGQVRQAVAWVCAETRPGEARRCATDTLLEVLVLFGARLLSGPTHVRSLAALAVDTAAEAMEAAHAAQRCPCDTEPRPVSCVWATKARAWRSRPPAQ